ncbi:peptide-methionine (R)-S-oxide reductase MsrB [Pseudomonas sp. MH10]|uniref:peptide-methionine (R)-S-oxide reductase MsrB n=1 Tax=Pseudomonas sp. MH10 TaxID=3048627 RepID=UPI002AC93858|nr:peptide-methionine (R)-S-oxide reductase MsrB [Pseudomonas sp. MH10]MEB0040061.1 peptide-methionine (R)-S-oxide reductase MsrB [Pseudomonas sp. MH10]WPX65190.1 peptide-methionine (R)-S-oxide reductase MsrB [Pseudomonas sp. MH10]
MQSRRWFLLYGSAGVALAASGVLGLRAFAASPLPATTARATQVFDVTHSDAEWHTLLTPTQYDVLRNSGTERPGSSPLNNEHRTGRFACAGCQLEAFSSSTKFESHTGWPSFTSPLANAVAENRDTSFGVERTEVHCRRCGCHLGHVFDDGPEPTGLRYCMNGVAMTFTPGQA